jgi:AcrR family transcriptional regulator
METKNSGTGKDREKTKQRLIEAVGSLLRTKGFQQVKVNEVASEAGVSKILIYRYFGDLDGLIDAYIRQKDFWISYQFEKTNSKHIQEAIKQMYREQIQSMRQDQAFKELHLKELADKKPLSDEIEKIRETHGIELINKVQESTQRPKQEVAALASILGGAITYLSLYEAMADEFNGIDLKSEAGWEQIARGCDLLIDLWFDNIQNK